MSTPTFVVNEELNESGKTVKEGVFSRDWDDESETDSLTDEIEAGLIDGVAAINVAEQLLEDNPDNFETYSFLGHLYWKTGMLDDAAEVYAAGYARAVKLIPKSFRGQIRWLHLDNRSFLRVAHGHLLSLMHEGDGRRAQALANKLLRWCPDDNLGIRFLLPDIKFLNGDLTAALSAYLKNANFSPVSWYPAALIAFRRADFVAACTYLRKGIAGNPYVAEALTGRVLLSDHLYWHSSNEGACESAVDYLESPVNVWNQEEIDFVDWVFNSSDVLYERAVLMEIREAMTHEREAEARVSWGRQLDEVRRSIDVGVSKKMVRKVPNRWDEEIWPWDREGRRTRQSVRADCSDRGLH